MLRTSFPAANPKKTATITSSRNVVIVCFIDIIALFDILLIDFLSFRRLILWTVFYFERLQTPSIWLFIHSISCLHSKSHRKKFGSVITSKYLHRYIIDVRWANDRSYFIHYYFFAEERMKKEVLNNLENKIDSWWNISDTTVIVLIQPEPIKRFFLKSGGTDFFIYPRIWMAEDSSDYN